MEAKKTSKSYSPEVRERAVRMVLEHRGEHASQWATICSIAAKIGCSGETLRHWVQQAERDCGARDGMTTELRDRLKTLVTRASVQLNLTQSAVSLQIKRLEEGFGRALFERNGRGVTLTSQGEQLVGYARRLLAMNDEIWNRMTAPAFVGEINLGCPDDLHSPCIPNVMHAFARSHPQVKMHLNSAQTVFLKDRFTRGELDVILTTEAEVEPGGETLSVEPLVWTGAPGGSAWRRRPLPLGTVAGCIFNKPAIETLNDAGFDWKIEIDSASNPMMDASIAADIVVRLHMLRTVPAQFEVIPHRGALPRLPDFCVNMYVTQGPRRRLVEQLAQRLRAAFAETELIAAE